MWDPHVVQYSAVGGFECRFGQRVLPKVERQIGQKMAESGENVLQALQRFIDVIRVDQGNKGRPSQGCANED